MAVKIILVLLLILSFISLGSAAFYMLKHEDGSRSMAKALTWRLGFSVGVFAFLMIAYLMGWITPHPLVLG